jgi:hypothetical protein
MAGLTGICLPITSYYNAMLLLARSAVTILLLLQAEEELSAGATVELFKPSIRPSLLRMACHGGIAKRGSSPLSRGHDKPCASSSILSARLSTSMHRDHAMEKHNETWRACAQAIPPWVFPGEQNSVTVRPIVSCLVDDRDGNTAMTWNRQTQ